MRSVSGTRYSLAALGLLAFGTGGIAQPAPVPPPIAQLGADCTRPQYASDRLVCGDPGLTALDTQVAALAAAPGTSVVDAILEDHYAWIRRRSMCASRADHRACLLAAYTDRLSVLVAASAITTQPWRCDGAWEGRNLTISAPVAGTPLTIRENGQLLAIATPQIDGWQPYLVWQAARCSVLLKAKDRRRFNCRPVPI